MAIKTHKSEKQSSFGKKKKGSAVKHKNKHKSYKTYKGQGK